jgi:hypothetical protein
MILGQAQPFASPEEALTHVGVKGMRWGYRKDRTLVSPHAKKSTTKKVTVGVGVVGMAAGAGFVAWKLGQNGKTPMSAVKASKDVAAVSAFLSKSGSSAKEISEAEKYAAMFLKNAGR